MKPSVRVVGGDALAKELRRLGDELDDALELAVGAGGQVIRGGAARRAPVRTGNLRRSITVETRRT